MKSTLFIFALFASLFSFAQPDEEPVTPLIAAIRSQNLDQVKKLVAAGADVNEEYGFNQTPVLEAVEKENLDIIKYLVSNGGTSIYAVSRAASNNKIEIVKYLVGQNLELGESMVYAAENNNLEMVKVLGEAGADVNFSQKRKTGLFRKHYVSPIGEALSHDNKPMVLALVKYGVPVKVAIEESMTFGKTDLVKELSKDLEEKEWLLMLAFETGHDDIVDFLIKDGVKVNAEDENGNSLLLIAASKGDLTNVTKSIEQFKMYLEKKNKNGETALMLAAQNGSSAVCEYLILKGSNIEAQNNAGETAIFYALAQESRPALDVLIAKGAKINHTNLEGNNLLIQAAIKGSSQTVTFLLDKGLSIDYKNKAQHTAFYYVVENTDRFNGNPTLQNAFLDAGADINTVDSNGESILFKAIEDDSDFERIKYLLDKGANPDVKNHKGQRPQSNEIEIMKLLINKGADINAVDDRHDTYMCLAVAENDLEFAHYLINKGIDVNQQCYFEEPPIIKAVEESSLIMVQFLADNGADVNAFGYMKKNVMDYAKTAENQEIIDFLKSRGAMTKEEKNARYQKAIETESKIKSALIAEDLTTVMNLMAESEVVILLQQVVQNIAYVACKQGNTTMMNKLLSDGVAFDINAPVNASKQTCLFIATIYSQQELVRDLLTRGADFKSTDIHGKVAEDYAESKALKKIFKQWHKLDK